MKSKIKPFTPAGDNIPEPAVSARPRRRLPSRKTMVHLGALLLLVVLLAFGLPYYFYARSHESTDDAFIDGHIVMISPRVSGHVSRVFVQDNQWVKAGDVLVELDPRDFQARLDAAKANLAAEQATGKSREIGVDITDIAGKAGEDEARANLDAARSQEQAAQAALAAAVSQQAEAAAQRSFAQAALEQSQAELISAQAANQRDSQDLDRIRRLASDDIATRQQLDHAISAERMSAAQLEATRKKIDTQQALVTRSEAAAKAARDNVRQAQALLQMRQAGLNQAQARLFAAGSAPKQVAQSRSDAQEAKANEDKARAEVQQAALNLTYTRITAPTDGYVTKKNVEPGAYVQVGQSMLAIVQPDLWVTANFKETQLTRMRPGQPVKISVDAYPGTDFEGHVASIQHGTGARFSLLPPENATGNYVKVVQRVPVKIVFDWKDHPAHAILAPGMSVVPEVDVAAAGTPQASPDAGHMANAAESGSSEAGSAAVSPGAHP